MWVSIAAFMVGRLDVPAIEYFKERAPRFYGVRPFSFAGFSIAARLKYTENRALSGGLRYPGRLDPVGLLIPISRGFRGLFYGRCTASFCLYP